MQITSDLVDAEPAAVIKHVLLLVVKCSSLVRLWTVTWCKKWDKKRSKANKIYVNQMARTNLLDVPSLEKNERVFLEKCGLWKWIKQKYDKASPV